MCIYSSATRSPKQGGIALDAALENMYLASRRCQLELSSTDLNESDAEHEMVFVTTGGSIEHPQAPNPCQLTRASSTGASHENNPTSFGGCVKYGKIPWRRMIE